MEIKKRKLEHGYQQENNKLTRKKKKLDQEFKGGHGLGQPKPGSTRAQARD